MISTGSTNFALLGLNRYHKQIMVIGSSEGYDYKDIIDFPNEANISFIITNPVSWVISVIVFGDLLYI